MYPTLFYFLFDRKSNDRLIYRNYRSLWCDTNNKYRNIFEFRFQLACILFAIDDSDCTHSVIFILFDFFFGFFFFVFRYFDHFRVLPRHALDVEGLFTFFNYSLQLIEIGVRVCSSFWPLTVMRPYLCWRHLRLKILWAIFQSGFGLFFFSFGAGYRSRLGWQERKKIWLPPAQIYIYIYIRCVMEYVFHTFSTVDY